jgi:hypothetical protein
MSAAREAIVLPLLFLTTTLIAGTDVAARVTLSPPSLFSLVLAALLVGTLVRCGAMAPARLLRSDRSMLANANGFVVVATLFVSAAQVLSMLTPRAGLPMLFVSVFLLVLLLNTWVAMPDAVRLLRSLAVTLGSALVFKFVILDGLASPSTSRTARVLAALFDVATLGTVTQPPRPAVAGYLAFVAVLLFLAGVSLLPRPRATETALVPR